MIFMKVKIMLSIYRIKDKKVGEGAYAVVYQGQLSFLHYSLWADSYLPNLLRSRGFDRKKGRH